MIHDYKNLLNWTGLVSELLIVFLVIHCLGLLASLFFTGLAKNLGKGRAMVLGHTLVGVMVALLSLTETSTPKLNAM